MGISYILCRRLRSQGKGLFVHVKSVCTVDHEQYHRQIQTSSKSNAAVQGNTNTDCIGRLILVRHGQSLWNVTCKEKGTTARFTGWADIGLTELGYEQATASGKAIQSFLRRNRNHRSGSGNDSNNNKIQIDAVYCSLLRRAKDTMNFALKELDLLVPFDKNSHIGENGVGSATLTCIDEAKNSNVNGNTHAGETLTKPYKIPVITSWRLNERHYGALVGLSKDGAERLYGKEKLTKWRNGWTTPPPPMDIVQLEKWIDLDHTRAATVVTDSYGDVSKSFNDNGNDKSNSETKKKREFTIIEKGPFFQCDFDDGEKTGLRITRDDLALPTKQAEAETTIPSLSQSSSSMNHRNNNMPASESLFDTCQRVLPIFEEGIAPRLRNGQTVVLFAHANTIRSLLYYIDPYAVTKHTLKQVKIPSAVPLLYSFQNYKKDENNFGDVLNEKYGGNEKRSSIPGGLRLIKNDHHGCNNHELDLNKESKNIIHLNGEWLKNEEMDDLSFCSDVGQQNLEHEIA